MKQVTIRIEESLHEALRLRSYESRESINAIIIDLLMKELCKEVVDAGA